MFWVKERIQFEKWPIYRHKESVVKNDLRNLKRLMVLLLLEREELGLSTDKNKLHYFYL